MHKKSPELTRALQKLKNWGYHSPSTVACATAVITLPATVKYPATVTIAVGKATGAAIIAPPTAAKLIPTVRITLKNFDVGALNRSIKDKLLFAMFFIIKNE